MFLCYVIHKMPTYDECFEVLIRSDDGKKTQTV